MSEREWKRMLLEPDRRDADPVGDAVDPAARHDRRRRSDRLRDRGARVRLNLTPMIDVTFLLLIFFVCTARGIEGERIFRVDVPPMEAGADSEAPSTAAALQLREPPLRVRVAQTANGTSVSIEPRFAEVDSIASLERVMRLALRDSAAPKTTAPAPGTTVGLFAANHPILLDPDQACSWEQTVAAFNALLRAGYRNVGFAGALDARPAGAPGAAAAEGVGTPPAVTRDAIMRVSSDAAS